jgi:DNA-binding MarR family transcriptional regulator
MAKTIFEKSRQFHHDLTVQIVLSLEHISRNIDNLLWQQALEHELSPLQIRILLFIRFHKEHSGVSLLAKEFNLSKATISVALKPMEQKKLVIKRKSESDGRNIDIALTDWGSQIAHVAGFYLEPLRKVIAHIPEQEKEIMLKNLTGILSKMTTE